MKKYAITNYSILLLTLLALVSCSPKAAATPIPAQKTPIAAASATVKLPLEETATAAPSDTVQAPAPATEADIRPSVTPVFIGTPIAQTRQEISLANLDQLEKVAEWGKGSIVSVAFAPDGNTFVAGTPFGLAVYNINDLSAAPAWRHFDDPFEYQKLYFSADSKYVLLTSNQAEQIRLYATGESLNMLEQTDDNFRWVKPQPDTEAENHSSVSVKSPDGSKTFESSMDYNSENMMDEQVSRAVNDAQGNLLYTLTDDVPDVRYTDRVEPEGCDLGVFSMCGNALAPLARAPHQVEFSPSGDVIAVLYNTPSLYDSGRFNMLRVYDAANGKFIMSLGSRAKPPVDFAFSPDSQIILVGYKDGSVERWRIGSEQAIFGARHMAPAIDFLTYTQDGKYLLIQRMDELEVRRTSDGAMLARYDSATFAISPAENLVAIGDADGIVHIRRIDSGEKVVTFQAHDDLIYSLAFSEDGRYLASGGRDCDIKLWDAKTGQFLHYFEETKIDPYEVNMNSRTFTYFMKFIPNTDTVVGFGSWGTAIAWDVNSGATKFVIKSAALDSYNGMVTLKPHFPEFFGVAPEKNALYINNIEYNLQSGEKVIEHKPSETDSTGCVQNGPVSNDKKVMFTIGYDTHEGQICVLDAQSMTLLKTIDVTSSDNRYFLDWLYLSPNGQQLIVNTSNGVIYVYETVQ